MVGHIAQPIHHRLLHYEVPYIPATQKKIFSLSQIYRLVMVTTKTYTMKQNQGSHKWNLTPSCLSFRSACMSPCMKLVALFAFYSSYFLMRVILLCFRMRKPGWKEALSTLLEEKKHYEFCCLRKSTNQHYINNKQGEGFHMETLIREQCSYCRLRILINRQVHGCTKFLVLNYPSWLLSLS